jgi:hypothetical protein
MNWIKENPAAAWLAVLTVGVFVVLGTLQGCDLRSRIVVKAPPDLLATVDVDEPLTLEQRSTSPGSA